MNTIRKVEAWLASGLYVLVVFVVVYPTVFVGADIMYGVENLFLRNNMAFDFFTHVVMPKLMIVTVIYTCFMLVNQLIMPRLIEQGKILSGVLVLVAVAGFHLLMVMIAFSYRYGYMLGYKSLDEFHTYCAGRAFFNTVVLASLYALYYSGKHLYFRYLHAYFTERQVWQKLTVELILMAAAWVIWMVVLMQDNRYAAFRVVFWTGVAYLALYVVLYYFVFPPFHRKEHRWPMLWRNWILLVAVLCCTSVLIIGYTTRVHNLGVVLTLSFFGAIIFMSPLAFVLSKVRMKEKNEVLNLEKALGRSSANLDFLRSQINPHFLFNALNTLYGTALQENALRTSEGVQRLGDMMRFMLHENHQEKIELTKEVGYLQNYIALQRLRTQASPDIKIEVNIREEGCEHWIAPMLLIPFVENAFKHGISLRSRSWIVVSLSCNQRYIYFDAYNSIHAKPENDPEKASLGIGLDNVRRRLALVYPGKHELSIRETGTEFFVHLTIDTQ